MSKSFRAYWMLLTLMVLSAVLTYLSRTYLSYEGKIEDVVSWTAYMAVMGILYAVVVGFVLVEALGRFASLDQTIDAEISALQDIHDMLLYFDKNQQTAVQGTREALIAYASSVAEREWDSMSGKAESSNEFSSPEINMLIQATNEIRVEDANDSVALNAIIEKLTLVTTLRTRRIYHANERIPPTIYSLIEFMSLTLIAGLVLMGVHNLWIHNLMVLSMTMAMFLAHKILRDIDDPFSGSWSFNNSRYLRLIEEGLRA
ncbi:MAG: hypothetical protein CMO64_07660 [Verrucomicrobiales bacterium]|nr:hypothetical protein [Verrucomicrobiales bacterium]|tara:strand:+ start:49 stop:825 length:777 start_codon:yes stop_codon:yes gene_type:complete